MRDALPLALRNFGRKFHAVRHHRDRHLSPRQQFQTFPTVAENGLDAAPGDQASGGPCLEPPAQRLQAAETLHGDVVEMRFECPIAIRRVGHHRHAAPGLAERRGKTADEILDASGLRRKALGQDEDHDPP